jgi:2-polyprenyl-3-methyl-5-hydroxy-6-metoxy-1,4-benzoquinol methylase
VLESGSAPGWQLVQFKRLFGYDPYGLEFSESGVTLNRKVFALNDINPYQVIHSDFFSKDFQEQHSSYFDVVLSQGFIEHFAEPEEVLKMHFDLLRKGGICIITIPNISGFNYLLAYVFNRKSLDMHNLEIMHKENFTKMISAVDPLILFLNYFGTFNFALFQCDQRILKPILSILRHFQRVLNVFFQLLFKDEGFESQYFSPNLGCISVKS